MVNTKGRPGRPVMTTPEDSSTKQDGIVTALALPPSQEHRQRRLFSFADDEPDEHDHDEPRGQHVSKEIPADQHLGLQLEASVDLTTGVDLAKYVHMRAVIMMTSANGTCKDANDSVRAALAALLADDTVDPAVKALLTMCAVVGKRPYPGARPIMLPCFYDNHLLKKITANDKPHVDESLHAAIDSGAHGLIVDVSPGALILTISALQGLGANFTWGTPFALLPDFDDTPLNRCICALLSAGNAAMAVTIMPKEAAAPGDLSCTIEPHLNHAAVIGHLKRHGLSRLHVSDSRCVPIPGAKKGNATRRVRIGDQTIHVIRQQFDVTINAAHRTNANIVLAFNVLGAYAHSRLEIKPGVPDDITRAVQAGALALERAAGRLAEQVTVDVNDMRLRALGGLNAGA